MQIHEVLTEQQPSRTVTRLSVLQKQVCRTVGMLLQCILISDASQSGFLQMPWSCSFDCVGPASIVSFRSGSCQRLAIERQTASVSSQLLSLSPLQSQESVHGTSSCKVIFVIPLQRTSRKMVKKVNLVSVRSNEITAQNFADRYGKDETKLEAWQMLCRDVGVGEGPSVTQCKKVGLLPYLHMLSVGYELTPLQNLKGVFVNLVDFMRAILSATAVVKYRSAGALANQIHSTGKVFRLRIAKQNKLLKELLIQVF